MSAPHPRFHIAAAMIAATACFVAFAPAGARAQATPDYAALLAAPDRSDADREADKRRDPTAVAQFRRPASGHEGARYGRRRRLQDRTDGARGGAERQGVRPNPERPPEGPRHFQGALKTPAMKTSSPTPAVRRSGSCRTCSDFDLITFLFYYHDTTYMKVDRAQMDRKMFAALKPGGYSGASPIIRRCRRRHLGRQVAASHRRERSCARSRSRRLQVRRRGRFLAHARRHAVTSPRARRAVAGR